MSLHPCRRLLGDLGAPDELGYAPAENPVHVHDFNATILHLLGIDHEQLTYRFQVRQYRLTNMTGSEWSTGKVGGALDFDGTDDYADLGTSLANNLGEVTFAAWIYREGSNSSYGEIFAKQHLVSFSNCHGGADKLHLNFGHGTGWGSNTESNSAIPMNQWVQLAGTRSDSTVKVYIDGVLERTGSNSMTGSNSKLLSV